MVEKKRTLTPEELTRLMDVFQARLDKEPLDIRNSVMHISYGVLNGSSWAFISKSDPEFEAAKRAFQESEIVSCYDVKGGILFSIPLEHVMTVLSRVIPELYGNKQKEIAVKKRKESNEALFRYIQGLASEKEKGRTARIGIYNLNDSPNITINGVVLKAFNVTLSELCVYLEQFGYGIKLGGVVVPAKEVRKAEKIGIVLKGLELAPSLRGILVDIAKL